MTANTNKKRRIGLKIILGVIFLAVVLHITLLVTGTTYLYKAAIYQAPGIDDLDVFAHRTVAAAPNAAPWAKASNYHEAELTPELREMLEKHRAVAFVAIKNGQLAYEEYWDGYSVEKNSNSFSAGKSIVSALIGIAQAEGKIKSLDDPVANYLPSFKSDGKEVITIRNVLQMASGLDFDEAYNQPISDTTEAYYGDNLPALVQRLQPRTPAGTKYRYKSGDTQVLAMIVQAATGQNIADYASNKLWQKIGAERDAQWNLDAEGGIEKAYCCFYSNALDFARFGYLYLRGGNLNGAQIVPADFVKQSSQAHLIPDDSGKPTTYYGYQWWRYDLPINGKVENVFYARGILGQYIFVFPEHDLVIVRLGHERGEKVNNHPTEVPVILRESLAIWGNAIPL